LIERRETALRPAAFVRDPGAQKKETIQRAARAVTGVAFAVAAPRGPVFQALGEIEKNWVRFAYLQL
jgi:hypothetical protein